MDIFANCYILIIFSAVYLAVALSCGSIYKLTGRPIYRTLRLLFMLMLAEWLFTVAYEILTYNLHLELPRLDSTFKLYQIPKVLIKNVENALIAVCIAHITFKDGGKHADCGKAFVITAAFTLFECFSYFMPDNAAWLFIRGASDCLCILCIIGSFLLAKGSKSRLFTAYSIFTLAASAVILFEVYADLRIPAVSRYIPEFYEAGDLYYFLASLAIFFGLARVRENASAKKIEADLEKKMELDLEQRIEEYKEEYREELNSGLEAAAEQESSSDKNELSDYVLGEIAKKYRLTKRESEIVGLAANGKSSAETAELLGISAATVRVHLHTASQKLDVSSKHELLEKLDKAAADVSQAQPV